MKVKFGNYSGCQCIQFGLAIMWHGHLDIIFDMGFFYVEITFSPKGE